MTMPKKEHPLPRPPKKRGGHAFTENPETGGLIFDKLQEAVAEGKVEEFMKENMPEGQYARKLTEMMMGMSGVPFAGKAETGAGAEPAIPRLVENIPGIKDGEAESPMMKVPSDVLQAAMEGNLNTLKDLLKREHEGFLSGPQPGKKKGGGVGQEEQKESLEEKNGSLVEKEIIDSLFEIAVDNNLDMDWLIRRALKLYIKKYRETGQL